MVYSNETQLIEEYDKLAWDIARKLQSKTTMELEDIHSECIIGLLKANRKYDSTKGKGFRNYAWYLMYYTALRSINRDGSFIKIPEAHKNDPQFQYTPIYSGATSTFTDTYDESDEDEWSAERMEVIELIGSEKYQQLVASQDPQAIEEIRERLGL